MSILRRIREKRLAEQVNENIKKLGPEESPEEYREQVRAHRHKRLSDLFRAAIPGILILSATAWGDSYGFGRGTSGFIADILTAVTLSTTIILVSWIVSRTYQPPSEQYFVTGKTDPANPSSAVFFEKWSVPKKIIEEHNIDGSQYSVLTTEGLMYFCDDLRWDPLTGKLNVTFGWPNLDRYSFMTKQEVYENSRTILKLLVTKSNRQAAYQEVAISVKSEEESTRRLTRLIHSVYDSKPTRVETDMEALRREIAEADEEVKTILTPESDQGANQ